MLVEKAQGDPARAYYVHVPSKHRLSSGRNLWPGPHMGAGRYEVSANRHTLYRVRAVERLYVVTDALRLAAGDKRSGGKRSNRTGRRIAVAGSARGSADRHGSGRPHCHSGKGAG